jgi:hypothetical protein
VFFSYQFLFETADIRLLWQQAKAYFCCVKIYYSLMISTYTGLWRKKVIHITLLITFMVIGAGCGNADKAPDVSNVKLTLQSQRLDKDLAALDTNNLGLGLQQLKSKYPDFLDFYLDTLMGFSISGNYDNEHPAIQKGLKVFLTHKQYRAVFDTVAMHFPDTKQLDGKLESAFRYMKHYYPRFKEPKVIYIVSGLNNWAAFTVGNEIMGVGLDMFLGGGYPFYKSVGLPDYMTNKLSPDYMQVAVMQAIYENMIPFRPEGSNLLEMLIQKGKEMYFIKKMLPDVPEAVRFGYTETQLEWCKQNEALVYNFFIQGNLLYEKDWQKILRYVNDGPTSAGMPSESPGNIGSWLGLQIVDAYMKNHPGMPLDKLTWEQIDAQQFLQSSGSKPR